MSSSNRILLCCALLLGVLPMITLILVPVISVIFVALALVLTLFILKWCLSKYFPAFARHVEPWKRLAARKLTTLATQALGGEIAVDSNSHTAVPESCTTPKDMAESNFLKAVLPSYSTSSGGTKPKEVTPATVVATAAGCSLTNTDEIGKDEMTSDSSIITSDTEDFQDDATPTSDGGDLLSGDKLFQQGEDASTNTNVCGVDHIVVKDADSSADESECFESASENAKSVSDDAGSLPRTIYECLPGDVADTSPDSSLEDSLEQSDAGQDVELLGEQDVSASDLVITQTRRGFFVCFLNEEELSSDTGQLVVTITFHWRTD